MVIVIILITIDILLTYDLPVLHESSHPSWIITSFFPNKINIVIFLFQGRIELNMPGVIFTSTTSFGLESLTQTVGLKD